MVWLLVRDTARRRWKALSFVIFQSYFYGRTLLTIWPATDPLAWPLACSWFIHSFAESWTTHRVITQLPVSRVDLWRARWWTVMLAPPLLVQPGYMLARWSLRSEVPSPTVLIVSIFWSALYCGVNMAIQRTPYGQRADAPAVPGRGLTTSVGIVLPMMLLQFGAPFVFAKYLPHRLAEFGAGPLVIATVMAGITLWGFLYQPAIVARPSMRRVSIEGRTRTYPPPQSPLNFGDRLTGLRLLFWRTVRRELMTYGLFLSMAVIAALLFAPDFREALRIGGALPFSGRPERVIEPMVYGTLLTMAGMIEIVTSLHLRSLRSLPLSTSQLAIMPAVLGVLGAASLWVLLLIVHFAVLGTDPISLRPDLFLAIAGTLTAMRAIRLALPGSQSSRHFGAALPAFAGLLIPIFALENAWITAGPTLMLTGAFLIAAAFVGTRWSIQRSQSVYRSLSIPVRL